MAKIRLTDKGVIKLTAINGKQTDFWDSILPGFSCRVSPSGRKSWVAMYRIHGRLRRMTVGTYPALTLRNARSAARTAFEKVELGIDPADEKKQIKSDRPKSFADLTTEYIERHAKLKKRTWKEDDRILKHDILPAWKNRNADSIERSDVIRLLDKIALRAPVAANRALALLRKLFNWAVEKDLLKSSPVVSVKAPTREKSRERVLSKDELKKIWNATHQMSWPWQPYYQMLILTLQRRQEVAGLLYSEIDWEGAEWLLDGARTKNGEGNTIPLAPLAIGILKSIDEFGSEFMFPARGHEIEGGHHISGFSRAKKRLDELSGVTNWRIHDIRRTGASYLAKLKTPPYIIEKILNHVSGEISGVAAIYNRYGYDEEKRRALDIWAQYIQDIASEETGKIVALHATQKR